MRATRTVVISSVLVLLLLIAFWLGRITAHGDEAEHGSHEEAPKAMKSSSEAAPHERAGNEPPGHVEAGAKPSGLTLTVDQKTNIGLKTVTADLRPIENVIRVAGVVKPHPDREAQVSSRVSGKVVGLFFKVGDAVQRGQRLAEVQSAEIQKVQVDLMQAENKLTLAKAELERIQNLVDSKIAARKELIAAQNQHQSVLNKIQGLERQLTILGLTETAVKKMREQKTIATFSVATPIGGVIAERNVVLGETVEPSKVIFKILDSSVVFVEGDAFEESIRELKIGQSVRMRLASYPDEVFAGKISRLSPTIDPQKRTLRLWVEVVNPSGKLKPNLFSEMNIVLGGQGEVLAIPQEALISTESESFVFVEEKGSFRRADVVLGARDDRFVEVKKGLLPGDRVVTDGKQQLYTQSLIARQGGAALGGHSH
jgi:cobalt-zinc-cadmium efflux system membrane fusion protein